MKHFINDRAAIVTEAIDAMVALSEGQLARLDGYPAIKVVVRADAVMLKDRQVAIISGGGSGHEPAHAGFVGDGMLTAAVCGEIFASPSVDAVLAAILAVTGTAGCLLIVKSYTGDRLNFGLAAEKARALGHEVAMVVVSDDVAIDGAVHPRGIAGTLFVHKVAGHLSRLGKSLAEVCAAAERTAKRTQSIGVALTGVSLPGQPYEERIGPSDVELGLGIHGEPGAEVVPLGPVRALADLMAARITGNGPFALLINDLGGVSPLEMALVANAVLETLKGHVRLVIGPERLMTSLDMKGFSVSALALDAEIEAALTAPVGPRAWPGARRLIASAPLPIVLEAKTFVPSRDPVRRATLETIARTFIALEGELNAIDARVGDGDTGTTFATAARALMAELDSLPFADPAALCAALSECLSKVMGGSSGILLAIFTAAAGARFTSWNAALRDGLLAVQHYGGAKVGDRTMLDAFIPALEALEAGESMNDVAKAARKGAEATATMTSARAGRSSYVRAEVLIGVPDPGAVAIAAAFEALTLT